MSGSTRFELSARDRKRLAAQLAGSEPLTLRPADGGIGLPPVARRAVEQLLTDLAAGGIVHVLAEDRDLTTQDVAEMLGLSRTFVVRLIDDGKLPAHLAGSHRRVRAGDAAAYAQQRHRRLAAAGAITDADRIAASGTADRDQTGGPHRFGLSGTRLGDVVRFSPPGGRPRARCGPSWRSTGSG